VLQELPELLEYFKYYTQDSICFNNQEFAFLALHHQKKKGAVYLQLKQKLNLSDSLELTSEITRTKTPPVFDNVLSELELTGNNDESYLLNQMLKKLATLYGPSRLKTLNKIDCEFKLAAPVFSIRKPKTAAHKEQAVANTPQPCLDSGNTTTKSPWFFKQRPTKAHPPSDPNPDHRRLGSCEVVKSGLLRPALPHFCSKQQEKEK
jgi:hypothetical protein